MENLAKEKTCKEDWKLFFGIVTRPIILFPLALVMILIYVNYKYEDSLNGNVRAFFDFFIAFFTGIASTQAMDKLNKDKDETKIKIKASSAIRNLFSISEKLKNIEVRIKSESEVEEIMNLVCILQDDVRNAKDDWGDIVNISEITGYQEDLLRLKLEKENLLQKNSEVEAKNSKSEAEGEKIKKKLEEKDREIRNLELKFEKYKSDNKLNVLGSLNHISASASEYNQLQARLDNATTLMKCKGCGVIFPGTNLSTGYCGNCGDNKKFLEIR